MARPPHDLEELRRFNPDRRSGPAGAHTGPSTGPVLAHVPFDRVLRAGAPRQRRGRFILAGPWPQSEQKPTQEAGFLGRHRGHLNDPVRAVALAIAAADALVVDPHLAVRRAMDRIGRAFLHAM